MSKKVYLNQAAEKEATDIGRKFMDSTDVVRDMSRAYGTDLSSVRIHTDGSAAQKAEERGVDAFSTGKDVFFARNAFNKNDPASRGLLAHELSHSLQQGVGGETGSITQSAPMGAEQGGILEWFRGLFGGRRNPGQPAEAEDPQLAAFRAAKPADKALLLRNYAISANYAESRKDSNYQTYYKITDELGDQIGEGVDEELIDALIQQQLLDARALNSVSDAYGDSAEGQYRARSSFESNLYETYRQMMMNISTSTNVQRKNLPEAPFMTRYTEKINAMQTSDPENYDAMMRALATSSMDTSRNTWAAAGENKIAAREAVDMGQDWMRAYAKTWQSKSTPAPEPEPTPRKKHHFRRWLNK